MTVKILTGTYVSGYVIQTPTTVLSLTASGYVKGSGISAAGTLTYTIVNYGRVLGKTDGIDLQGAGDVVNLGVVASAKTSSGQHGVYLGEGGEVSNGTLTNKGATISGYGSAVRILGKAGTIVNFGTIVSTDTVASHPGIQLNGGGTVTNAGLIEGGAGLAVNGGAATVTNSGTITAALGGGIGLDLANGGQVTNQTGGQIAGGTGAASATKVGGTGGGGILLSAGGSIVNAGTVAAGAGGKGGGAGGDAIGYAGGAGSVGITLVGASLINSGIISGGAGGYGGYDLGAGGAGGAGVTLAGGSLYNFVRGAIYGGEGGEGGFTSDPFDGPYNGLGGAGGVGITISAGSISNAGTIRGGGEGYGAGVYHFVGGSGIAQLAGSVSNAGTILGGFGGGVGIARSGGSITNSGTVEGGLGAGAGIAQGGGSLSNSGAILGGGGARGASANDDGFGQDGGEGGAGATLAGGSTTNTGMIQGGQGGAGAALDNYGDPSAGGGGGTGMTLSAGAATNTGTVQGGQGGVGAAGGSTIYGYEGPSAGGAGGAGATLTGGTLTNTGKIFGGQGAAGGGAGYGYPAGSTGIAGDGAAFSGAGLIFNGSASRMSALIEGYVGVYGAANSAGTVTNFGTIDGTGGIAVEFRSGGDRLIVEAGSTLIGRVAGGGGTLELAKGKGTITGLAGAGTVSGTEALTFSGLDGFDLDAGGTWTLAGGAGLASGQSLTVASGATARVVGGDGAVYAGAGVKVTVTNFGTIDGTGGASVVFKDDLDRLIAGVGSVFDGSVAGGGGTLELDGGTGTITNLSGTGSIKGAEGLKFSGFDSFDLDAGGIWTLAGGVILAGGQSLTIAGGATAKIVGAETLTGGGTVSLNATGQVIAGDGTTALTNGDTIVGAGVIGGKLVLDNAAAGVIDAGTGQLEISLKGAAFTNAGLVETTGPGTLLVAGATIANIGTVSANKTVELYRSTIAGGNVSVAAGGVLKGVDGAISGATITNVGTLAAAKGGLVITGAVTNTGLLLADGGDLTITGAVTGAGQARIVGDVLEVDGALGETVTFAGNSPGTLILGDSAAFTGTIAGLSKTGANRIHLKDIAYNAADTVAYSVTTGALTVSNAGHAVLATLKLSGNYAGSTFKLKNGGVDGTVIFDPRATAFASAMAGLGADRGSSASAAAVFTSAPAALATPHSG